MTLSTLSSLTLGTSQPPMTKAEYLNLVAYSRKFEAEDIFFNEVGTQYPNLNEAAIRLVENGETAWDTPEFEAALYDIFRYWVEDGLLLRVQFFSQWLLATVSGDTRQWLEDFASGNWWTHLSGYGLSRSIFGSPEDFLYPLQIDKAINAQLALDLQQTQMRKQPRPHSKM